jgi:hypothetical protein
MLMLLEACDNKINFVAALNVFSAQLTYLRFIFTFIRSFVL